VGYTPSPEDSPKVIKTSLGAEKSIHIQRFDTTQDMLDEIQQENIFCIAAEITSSAIDLNQFSQSKRWKSSNGIAVIFGNEINGVCAQTLQKVDQIVYVPMK